jgi:geranylgeranyl diphosphate synthase, type II
MSARPSAGSFSRFVSEHGSLVEAALTELLPPKTSEPLRLHEAMHYAMFPGGKRLRPMLTLLGCVATGGQVGQALRPAAALECLHTYSLVHDDLPCMDDDDLRRGRQTCHKVYGESMALLAGDALLTLAFEGVSEAGGDAVKALAVASGSVGMVGGQVEDLAAEGESEAHTLERLKWIHDHKTGALITAALVVGAHAGASGYSSGVPDEVLGVLKEYGDRLGRAFQIADDCLDMTGSAAELGKNPGADVALGKLTWPALVGLEESRQTARELVAEAATLASEMVSKAASWRAVARRSLDGAAELLQDVAFYTIDRRS